MERSAEVFSPAVESLRNYHDLLDRIDALCRRIEEDFPAELACEKGCSHCCRHISLFWVEAVALALAVENLPEDRVEALRERARFTQADGPCPLLEQDACLLYDARPIICRTHGLPVLNDVDGARRVDFCERNFRGLSSLPAHAVIDLNLLNTTLAAINNLFVSEVFHGRAPERERLTIAEALLLDL